MRKWKRDKNRYLGKPRVIKKFLFLPRMIEEFPDHYSRVWREQVLIQERYTVDGWEERQLAFTNGPDIWFRLKGKF